MDTKHKYFTVAERIDKEANTITFLIETTNIAILTMLEKQIQEAIEARQNLLKTTKIEELKNSFTEEIEVYREYLKKLKLSV